MQVPALSASPFSALEPAFVTAPGERFVTQGWCPISRLESATPLRKQSAGLAWGDCDTRWFNVRDASTSCQFENRLESVTWGVDAASPGSITTTMLNPTTLAPTGRSATLSMTPAKQQAAAASMAGVTTTSASPSMLAGAWAPTPGSPYQGGTGGGPTQSSSYGSYSGACNGCGTSGELTYAAGTSCASPTLQTLPCYNQTTCGPNNGTKYFTQMSTYLGNRMSGTCQP